MNVIPKNSNRIDRQPIQIVFSRPVIALGEDFSNLNHPKPFEFWNCNEDKVVDIPGTFRWVTTSIARFDATGGENNDIWPVEQCVRIHINENLSSYDNVPLDTIPAELQNLRFESNPLAWHIAKVQSEEATSKLGTSWSSTYYNGYELPPDARVDIWFSYPVEKKYLADIVKIRLVEPSTSANTPSITFVDECEQNKLMDHTSDEQISCATFDVRGLDNPIENQKSPYKYQIFMGKNSVFNTAAGSLNEELVLQVTGLWPFVFNFFPKQGDRMYRRFRLHLPHGLSADSISLLQDSFQFTPNVEFSLDLLDTTTILVKAKVNPGVEYTLQIHSNPEVKDLFDLPLVDQSTTLLMAKTGVFISNHVYDGQYAQYIPVLDNDVLNSKTTLLASPLAGIDGEVSISDATYKCYEGNVKDATFDELVGFFHSSNQQMANPLSSFPVVQSGVPQLTTGSLEQLDVCDLGTHNSLILAHTSAKLPFETRQYTNWISKANFTASFISQGKDKISFWILDTNGNPITTPTEEIVVKVYERMPRYYGNDVQKFAGLIGSTTTTADKLVDGVLTMDVKPTTFMSASAFIHISSYGTLVLPELHGLRYRNNKGLHKSMSYRAAIVTDRLIYKLGDEIKVKVYVRKSNGKELIDFADTSVVIKANFGSGDSSQTITLDPNYASASTTFIVPDTARFGPKSITLLSTDNEYIGQSSSFVIADPRIPTAKLDVTSDLTHLNIETGIVPKVNTLLSTYTGVPIANTEIKVSWSVIVPVRYYYFFSMVPEPVHCTPRKGEMSISTTIDGTAEINLAILEDNEDESLCELEHNSQVEVVMRVEDPTGAEITEKITFDVKSERHIQIESPTNPVPGIPFRVRVDTESYLAADGTDCCEALTLNCIACASSDMVYDYCVEDNTYADRCDALINVHVQLYAFKQENESSTAMLRTSNVNSFGSIADMETALNIEPVNGQSCKIPTNDLPTENPIDQLSYNCEITLPKAEKYVIVAHTVRQNEQFIFKTKEVGKTATQWESSPLTKLDGNELLQLAVEKMAYVIGETVSIELSTPFAVSNVMLLYSVGDSPKHVITRLNGVGKHNIDVKIDETFGSQNQIMFSIVLHPVEFDKKSTFPVDFPVSRNFVLDLVGIQSLYSTFTVSIMEAPDVIASRNIAFTTDIPAEPMAPGQEFSFNVEVPSLEDNAEVTVFMVDKAILDLKPYDLPILSDIFISYTPGQVAYVEVSGAHATWSPLLKEAVSEAIARYNMDPWLCPELIIGFNNWYNRIQIGCGIYLPFHVPRAQVLLQAVADLTPMPFLQFDDALAMESGGLGIQMDAAIPMLSSESSDGMLNKAESFGATSTDATNSDTVVDIRSAFDTAPLFVQAAKTVNGKVLITGTLPDNVGTFNVRILVAKEGRTSNVFGSKDTEIIVRKPLNAVQSSPRIARVGDRFESGVSVSLVDPSFVGTVEVEAIVKTPDLVQLVDVLKTKYKESVQGSGPYRMQFMFQANENSVGSACIEFHVKAADNSGNEYTDAIETTFDIEAPQHPVRVASAMSLPLNPVAEIWPEGLHIPVLFNGYGSLDISAGFGFSATHLASFTSMYDDAEKNSYWWKLCKNVASSVVPSVILSTYGYTTTSPHYLQAQTFTGTKSKQILQKCTSYNSLLYATISHGSSQNLIFTADFIFLQQTLTGLPNSESPILDHFSTSWNTILDRQIQQWEQQTASVCGMECMLFTSSAIRLVKGLNWVNEQFDTQTLIDHAVSGESCSPLCAANVALLLAKSGLHTDSLNAILETYYGSYLRIQGQSAYISYHNSRRSIGLEATCKFLNAMVLSDSNGTKYPLMSKIAVWVSMELLGANGGYGYNAPFTIAIGTTTLAHYDSLRKTLDGNGVLSARSGNDVVFSGHWITAKDAVVYESTPFTEIAPSSNNYQPLPVLYRYGGKSGELMVNTVLNFIPKHSFVGNGIYRGFMVEKSIQAYDFQTKQPIGPNLSVIEPGIVVQVTIQFSTPDDVGPCQVIDLVPAGLEPMDPFISKDATPSYCFFGWFCSILYQETTKSSVSFSSYSLSAGTYTVQYLARSVTSGVFVYPPTLVFASRQPEVMGLSGSKYGVVAVTKRSEPKIEYVDEVSYLNNLGITTSNMGTNNVGTMDCTADCTTVNAFCDIREQKCVCPDGNFITGVLKECAGMVQQYATSSLLDGQEMLLTDIDFALEVTGKDVAVAVQDANFMWSLRTAVANVFPKDGIYVVSPQDVFVEIKETTQVNDETVRLTITASVSYWAAYVSNISEEAILSLSETFLRQQELSKAFAASENELLQSSAVKSIATPVTGIKSNELTTDVCSGPTNTKCKEGYECRFSDDDPTGSSGGICVEIPKSSEVGFELKYVAAIVSSSLVFVVALYYAGRSFRNSAVSKKVGKSTERRGSTDSTEGLILPEVNEVKRSPIHRKKSRTQDFHESELLIS